MGACTSRPRSLHVDLAGGRKGERSPTLGFLPLECVRKVFLSLPCCVLKVSADARDDDSEIKQ